MYLVQFQSLGSKGWQLADMDSIMQAHDGRFVNASVEFNVKTLMPTYRLQWGTAGESQALAVAEGLGFDADIVKAANEIAQQSAFSSRPGRCSVYFVAKCGSIQLNLYKYGLKVYG